MPRQGPVVYVNVGKFTLLVDPPPENHHQNKFDQTAPNASKPRHNPPNHLKQFALSTNRRSARRESKKAKKSKKIKKSSKQMPKIKKRIRRTESLFATFDDNQKSHKK